MTQEEKEALLQEARRRYPVGTKFIPFNLCFMNYKKDVTISSLDHSFDGCGEYRGIWVSSSEYRGVVYLESSRTWAEIVYTPQPQFEEGKWYKFTWDWSDRTTILIKISSVSENINGYAINLKTNYILESFSCILKEVENPIEVHLSEIQQYLPEGHEDRLDKFAASTEEEWEPKVGDEVELVEENISKSFYSNALRYCRGNPKKGKITKTHILGEGKQRGLYIQINHGTTNVPIDCYRKALPHEIPGNKQQAKKTEWEPSVDACKKCAAIYYDGSVNSGPHNLCEGRHCKDMQEDEEQEVDDVIQCVEPDFKPVVSVTQELYRRKKTILFNN